MNYLLSVPPVYRWTASLIFLALVIALSIAPGVPTSDDSVFVWLIINTATPVQKMMHVTVYAILAFLWVWTLQSIKAKTLRFALVLIIAIGLGMLLEWQQTHVPGRFGSVSDVLLNIVGVLLGLLAAFVFLRQR